MLDGDRFLKDFYNNFRRNETQTCWTLTKGLTPQKYTLFWKDPVIETTTYLGLIFLESDFRETCVSLYASF